MSDQVRGGKETQPRNERDGRARARITEMADIPRLLPAELDRLRIVHPVMPDTKVMAAFERLLAKLLERTDGKNFVVAVAGLTQGSGGSFVAVNLAATIALDHHRTALLISGGPDSDAVGRLLMLPPDYGLTEYLADPSIDVEGIIYSSRIPRLRMIPYGKQAFESRLLHSTGMQHLLQLARARYSDRFVVVDIPSATPTDTVRQLAQWCDFAVLVVPYADVGVHDVRAAADAIGRDKLVGVVINRDPAP
jgi:protein-tyrosine kinase